MEQCKKCAIYSNDYNDSRQILNDIKPLDTQYCCMYNSGIPENIIDDKTECQFKILKNE